MIRDSVLVDLAVILADGGEAIADIATLTNQPTLHGPVASAGRPGGCWPGSTRPAWPSCAVLGRWRGNGPGWPRPTRAGGPFRRRGPRAGTWTTPCTVLDLALGQLPEA